MRRENGQLVGQWRQICGVQGHDRLYAVNSGRCDQVGVVDAFAGARRVLHEREEGREDRPLLGEQADASAEFADVFECVGGRQAEAIRADGAGGDHQVFADDLCGERERGVRLDEPARLAVLLPCLVRRFEKDVRVDEQHVSARRRRR